MSVIGAKIPIASIKTKMKDDEFVEKATDKTMDIMKNSFEEFFKKSPFAGQLKKVYSQDEVHTAMMGAYMGGGTMVFKIIRAIEGYKNEIETEAE